VYISSLVADLDALYSTPLQNESVIQNHREGRLNLRTCVHRTTDDYDQLPSWKRMVRAGRSRQPPQPTSRLLIKEADDHYGIRARALSAKTGRVKVVRTRRSKRQEFLRCGGRRHGCSAGGRNGPVAKRSLVKKPRWAVMAQSRRELLLHEFNRLRRQVKPSAANMLFMVTCILFSSLTISFAIRDYTRSVIVTRDNRKNSNVRIAYWGTGNGKLAWCFE